MSYSKVFHANVPFSRIITYDFPASENGGEGRITVEDSEPISIEIEIDTDKFDESISETHTALNAVGGALTAAEAAQVAAITQSGKQISAATIQGFFRVITSELSTRVSELGSSMRSSVGLLAEEAISVDRIHGQMETDYAAIKARYKRIFAELDRELDRRIKELDSEAFALSSQAMGHVVDEPLVREAPRVLTYARDTTDTPLKLTCARAKEFGAEAIGDLGSACEFIVGYNGSVSSIVEEGANDQTVYLPVAYAFEEDLQTKARRIVVQEATGGENEEVRRGLMRYVGSRLEDSQAEMPAEGRRSLDESYARLVEAYGNAGAAALSGGDMPATQGMPATGPGVPRDETYQQRVRQQMMRLYGQTTPTTIRA